MIKLPVFVFLPDVACRLQSSEPNPCSSSLQSVHTPVYSPPMSPVTAQMAEKETQSKSQQRKVLASPI